MPRGRYRERGVLQAQLQTIFTWNFKRLSALHRKAAHSINTSERWY